jgi:cobalt-zinc-cadmium efflux system membrane fusion protein
VVELSKEEMEMIKIETVQATFSSLRSQLFAMGKVLAHPLKKAIVSYAFPARISQIHFRIGDWVKPGQILVTLQSEEVGSAKSEFYKAMADYELAEVNFEREKSLFDRGVGAKKNFITAEAELKVARVSLNAAEKKLHVLGFTEKQVKTISETHQINPVITLFAPIRGKIIENNAVLGAMIDQTTEILTIMDPTILCIDAEIYEKDIAKTRIEQDVEITVPAYPGESFMGKTCYISDVLKEETRTITVRTEVENTGYKLKPGMFADIKIFLNHQTKVLVLPREAILDEKDEKIVFVKREGKYFPLIVQTGIKEKGYVEILSGIREGDEVVTRGNFQLKSKLYDGILKKAHVH